MTQQQTGREPLAPSFPESEGVGTDGSGSPGMVEESRPARAGETDTTRFGMEAEDTDGAGGAVENRNEETDA